MSGHTVTADYDRDLRAASPIVWLLVWPVLLLCFGLAAVLASC